MNDINSFKELGDQLAADGWHISASKTEGGYDSWLRRSEIDDRQFFGHGQTMLEAMKDAVAKRDVAVR